MAVKRYPLNSIAIEELQNDIQKMWENLPGLAEEIVTTAGEHAENYFNGHLSRATPGRQAVISTEVTVEKNGKYGRTARLTATGKTEDTGFNILMAVEFGAGIAYNFGGWSDAFPAMQLGPGTWPGQTHAYDFRGWNYPTGEKDEKGRPIYRHTFGTPSTMPMHYTILDMKQEFKPIAEEAFRRWLS